MCRIFPDTSVNDDGGLNSCSLYFYNVHRPDVYKKGIKKLLKSASVKARSRNMHDLYA